jgi:hypothetical protein
LSRLGRLCVVLPLIRRFLAVNGPKLDPSFAPCVMSEANNKI